MQTRKNMRRPEMLARTGLSRTTQYELEKRGEFPKRFMASKRTAVWDSEEVEAWIDSRKQAAFANAPAIDGAMRALVGRRFGLT